MTSPFRGSVLKARPALQRWQDSPVTRAAIGIRWVLWLAKGWPPTTTAILTAVALVTLSAPVLVFVTAAAVLWAITIDQGKTFAALVAVVGGPGAVWWTWTTATTTGQLTLIALASVWPLDTLAGIHVDGWRRRRWWCEFVRGFPVRYAIMAAKSTRIQGAIDGEQQLRNGRRPILDHPAIAHRATFDGDTAWAICSVSPGRDAAAFQEVLQELAASFIRVQRLDLVFVDDYQTYGHLVTTFGPPLLADTPQHVRVARLAHTAGPHAAIAAAVVAATWTAIT